MRNRINLSRSNYKEPYIRQSCTNARAGRIANCGRAKVDKDREGEGGRRVDRKKERRLNEIKGTEIEQHASEEENETE